MLPLLYLNNVSFFQLVLCTYVGYVFFLLIFYIFHFTLF
jgi:hypothetical protein